MESQEILIFFLQDIGVALQGTQREPIKGLWTKREKRVLGHWDREMRSTQNTRYTILLFCCAFPSDWIISFVYSSSFLLYRISAEVPVRKADPLLSKHIVAPNPRIARAPELVIL